VFFQNRVIQAKTPKSTDKKLSLLACKRLRLFQDFVWKKRCPPIGESTDKIKDICDPPYLWAKNNDETIHFSTTTKICRSWRVTATYKPERPLIINGEPNA
jgi:hypothetical protein